MGCTVVSVQLLYEDILGQALQLMSSRLGTGSLGGRGAGVHAGLPLG